MASSPAFAWLQPMVRGLWSWMKKNDLEDKDIQEELVLNPADSNNYNEVTI